MADDPPATRRLAPFLGVIADDHTGATDVASALARSGARVELRFGPPTEEPSVRTADALVVALKSRDAPAGTAVDLSLAAARWLRAAGVRRWYLKICSTFDSTDAGNIGPVADSLLDEVGGRVDLVCPASPEHGRTVYQGHLFVGSRLLSESAMRHHPRTPMTDPDLVSVLGRQTPRGVALVPHELVREGPARVAQALDTARDRSAAHVIADAVSDADLRVLALATRDQPLTTGGAGLARLIGEVELGAGRLPAALPSLPAGPVVILAGSQSERTGEQVEAAAAAFPTYRLDEPDDVDGALAWLDGRLGEAPLLIHSWVAPHARGEGRPAFETAMGRLAGRAVELGARRLVVAGGETSGAIVDALGIGSAEVLGEEDRGVPWLLTHAAQPVALLLKSGNFGAVDLLVRAATR